MVLEVILLVASALPQAYLQIPYSMEEKVNYRFCSGKIGLEPRVQHLRTCASWNEVRTMRDMAFPEDKTSWDTVQIELAWKNTTTTIIDRDFTTPLTTQIEGKGIRIKTHWPTTYVEGWLPRPSRIDGSALLALARAKPKAITVWLNDIDLPADLVVEYFEAIEPRNITFPDSGKLLNVGIYSFKGTFDVYVPYEFLKTIHTVIIADTNMNCSCNLYGLFKMSEKFRVFLPQSACIAPEALDKKMWIYMTHGEYQKANGDKCLQGQYGEKEQKPLSLRGAVEGHRGWTKVDLVMAVFILTFKLLFGGVMCWELYSHRNDFSNNKVKQNMSEHKNNNAKRGDVLISEEIICPNCKSSNVSTKLISPVRQTAPLLKDSVETERLLSNHTRDSPIQAIMPAPMSAAAAKEKQLHSHFSMSSMVSSHL